MWDSPDDETYGECVPLIMLSNGGLQKLHLADDDAINCFHLMAMKTFAR